MMARAPLGPPEPPRPPARRSPGHAGLALLGLASAIFLLIAWLYRNFTLDDPFITFRYAKHLLHGHGPVYNPGERVEGFSNPLWVLVSAALMALLGTEAETVIGAAKLVGALFGLVALLGCWRLANVLCPSPTGGAGGAATLLLSLTVYFPLWSVGGLETPLFAAALVWLVVSLIEEEGAGGSP